MAAKIKQDREVVYEITFSFHDKNPLIVEIRFSTVRGFLLEMSRIVLKDKVWRALRRNNGISFKLLKQLPEEALPKPEKEVRVIVVYVFTDEQMITNARMAANVKAWGVTRRAVQIYQLMDADVQTKNITDFLPVTIGTIYGNCSVARALLNLPNDLAVIKLLKTLKSVPVIIP